MPALVDRIVSRLAPERIVVFGAQARGDERPDSDLDLLVEPTRETTLFDLGAIQIELQELLGLRVDVLTPRSLPEAFRQRVQQEAVPV
ncbi:MAG: nucleotidyltransferase family protein [Candidatus Sericytochromatia bacterium]|nr:nucleotidyltransferase family protein [Candidatus Sericytochromatia bacterium]